MLFRSSARLPSREPSRSHTEAALSTLWPSMAPFLEPKTLRRRAFRGPKGAPQPSWAAWLTLLARFA